ncbi:MAG: tetratricopeptide repeat protein [Pseudomonadota bacterium]
MANDESAIREVDQELAEERQWALFRKNGPIVIGGAVAILAVVAGTQLWNARQAATSDRQALEFKNAIELLAEEPDNGRSALDAIAEEGGTGYAALAQMQSAAALARNGDRLSAIEAFAALSEDRNAPERVRELARLRAGYLSLADGRAAVLDILGGLPEESSANGYFAKEIVALSQLQDKEFDAAIASFDRLASDIATPAGVRDRAEEFAVLAAAGKSGVNIFGEARVDDVLNALGSSSVGDADEVGSPAIESSDGGEAQGVEDHTGQDHDGENNADVEDQVSPPSDLTENSGAESESEEVRPNENSADQ